MRELLRDDTTIESVEEHAAKLEGNARIRLNAIAAAYHGKPLREIASEAGVPPSTIMDWVLIFKEEGVSALVRKKDPGRLPGGYDGDQLLALALERRNKPALMATAMAYRGATADQVAEYLEVDVSQVAKWLITFRKDGPSGLTRYKKRKKRAIATEPRKLPRNRRARRPSGTDDGKGAQGGDGGYRLRSDYDAISLFNMKDDFCPEHRPRFAALVAAYMTNGIDEAAAQRTIPVELLVEWLDDFNINGVQKLLMPGKKAAPLARPAWPSNGFKELSSERLERLAEDADSDAARVRLGALKLLASGLPLDVVARRYGESPEVIEGWVAAHVGVPHLLGAMMALTSAEK